MGGSLFPTSIHFLFFNIFSRKTLSGEIMYCGILIDQDGGAIWRVCGNQSGLWQVAHEVNILKSRQKR